MTIENLTADVRVHHATRAKAEKLDAMLAAEYPNVRLRAVTVDEGGVEVLTGWEITDAMGDLIRETEDKKVPELADVLEAFEEADVDPTEGEEDEEDKPSGSVVDEVYRRLYREVSTNGQTCGDWLAEWLTVACHAIEGFSVEDFEAVCSNNGVDLTAKWAQITRGPGWKGRYRMNGRQALEKRVAISGKLYGLQGEAVEIPEEEIARLRTKHAKAVEKAEKAAKAEQQEGE